MKYQVYFGIALRIICLFGVGFLMTYVNPAIADFLGDHPCTKPSGCGGEFGNRSIEWTASHYWYSWCLAFLFILSLVNVVIGSIKLIGKHYTIHL